MDQHSRRLFLRSAAGATTIGLAGCSSLIPDQSTDNPQNESKSRGSGAVPVPDETDFEFEYTDGAVEIRLQSGEPISASNVIIRSSEGTEVSWPKLGSTSVATDGSITSGDTATVGPSVLNWPDEIRPSQSIFVIYMTEDGAPTTIGQFDLSEEITTTAAPVPDVLQKPLPDPEEYINGQRESFSRSIGSIRIDTQSGDFYLEGPGAVGVTGIAGYISAGDLQPTGSWGGSVDENSKLFGTSATDQGDHLLFDQQSFGGIALRAVDGITLQIDGTVVAEEVELVRYTPQRGVYDMITV